MTRRRPANACVSSPHQGANESAAAPRPGVAAIREGFFCSLLVAAAVTDLLSRRVPNRLTGWGGLLLLAMSAVECPSRASAAIAWGAAVSAAPLLLHLARPSGLGGGDVKLAALIGIGIGQEGLAAVFLGCLSVLACALPRLVVAGRSGGDVTVALAPHLGAGALAMLIMG